MFWRGAIILLVGYLIHYFWVSPDKVTAEMLAKHPVRQLTYWKNWQDDKLSERIRTAPTQILDYLRKDNIKNGWVNRPKAVGLEPDMRNDLVEALAGIPEDIRLKISRKTVGIFVVTDLGGSAFSESVNSGAGKPEYGFVVLDISVLDRRANEWATWKESSPFVKSSNYTLTARIADTEKDNRVSALRYILLHEFGHVLSIGHPPLFPGESSKESLSPSQLAQDFFDLCWEQQEDKTVVKQQELFPSIAQLHYYGNEDQQLPASSMEKAYSFLEKTAFPTLYAATNPADDFAESFVSYVHTVRMGQPFEIKIFEDGAEVKSYQSCWDQPRCAQKRELLEKFLALDGAS